MKSYSPEEKTQGAAHFEALFDRDKIWYTSKEAAALLGMSVQFVREAFDNQALMGQEISSRRGPDVRRVKMIHRDCLLIYLMETANYRPQDFLQRLQRLMAGRPREELNALRAWLEAKVRGLRN
jgi:hypothetical protein